MNNRDLIKLLLEYNLDAPVVVAAPNYTYDKFEITYTGGDHTEDDNRDFRKTCYSVDFVIGVKMADKPQKDDEGV